MNVIEFDPPTPKGNAERQREYRRRHGSNNDARKNYRRNNSKWTTDADYLSRPIIFLDGEGYTVEDGSHLYTLFGGMSSVDGAYRYIQNPHGLSTASIFDFVLELAADTPKAITAIYGGSYDFNMWLSDLTRDECETLYTRQWADWDDYKLAWRRGKTFYMKRGSESVMVYDVVSFFQRPFVDACDEYLCNIKHEHKDAHGYILHTPECWEDRNRIIANKAKRGTFEPEDMASMIEYNAAELRNAIRLVQELRARLNKVTLRPRRWDGPGAIAASLLLREGVKDAMCPSPVPVAAAARHAYAGGRFEVIRFGHVEKPAWEYDINSAYPYALTFAPNLMRGRWEYTRAGVPVTAPFSVVQIESRAYRTDIPAPLFCRLPNGSIAYPQNVTGWYWRPELDAVAEYCRAGYGEYRVLGAWQFREDENIPKPFAFIEPLFRKRKALKKGGDGAHVGIKLGLNSLYGKLAQQVGAHMTKSGWRIPPFHQIEWAGYVTSHCRARMLKAALTDIDAIIAFETDALFSSRPLPLDTGDDLGQFGSEAFSNLTYVQSGVYFATHPDGSSVTKSRGVDRGDLTRESVLAAFTAKRAEDRQVKTSLTRFVTLGVALAQDFQRWTHWEKLQKAITCEPIGKRIHSPYCEHDAEGMSLGVWHETICPFMGDMVSAEYPVLWENPNPAMNELAEMRQEETYYE